MNQNFETENEPDFVEHCWALIGWHKSPLWFGELVRPTTGTATTVEFDGQWILEREESNGDIIGFLHTHPTGSPEPSQRDVNTMRAWSSSFGKPLLCLIETERQLASYLFEDDECSGRRIPNCQRLTESSLIVFEEQQEPNESVHVE